MTVTDRQPVLFLAHGTPATAIRDTLFTRYLSRLGGSLRPRAVVIFTAHWEAPVTTMTWRDTPHQTIHGFGPSWPPALFALRYPALGSTAVAGEALELLRLAGIEAAVDTGRGLDHGAWAVLRHLFPAADVPVVQVSIDPTLLPAGHLVIGAALKALRDRGVLIIASGATVHNPQLHDVAATEPWALEFDDWVLARLRAGDRASLFDYARRGPNAAKAAPTAEHFVPLLVALGAIHPGEVAHTLYRGYENLQSYLSLAFDAPGRCPVLARPEDAAAFRRYHRTQPAGHAQSLA